VALGQLAMRGREYVVSLKPCGRGMVLETLRYADEVNKASSYFRDIADAQPDEELLDLATTLIDKKTAPFDAGEFHNRYVDALKDLIERKKANRGTKIVDDSEPRPKGANVVDLMAALKKSLGSVPARTRRPQSPPPRRKPPPRRRRRQGSARQADADQGSRREGRQGPRQQGRPRQSRCIPEGPRSEARLTWRRPTRSPPTMRSAISGRPPSRRVISAPPPATASSSRSMTRPASTGTSGSSWTAC
jgi:hypothetical protein